MPAERFGVPVVVKPGEIDLPLAVMSVKIWSPCGNDAGRDSIFL
jgi:hypothetical protein